MMYDRRTTVSHRVLILCVMIMSIAYISYADIIYVRGNQRIEGTITKETDDEVFIDIGVGTISFRRNEIEKIAKGKKEDGGEAKDTKQLTAMPSTYIERLFARLRAIKEKRYKVIQAKKTVRSLFKRFTFYDQRYLTYTRILDDVNKKAHERHAVGDILGYNNLLVRMNTLRAKRIHLITEAQKVFEAHMNKGKDLFDSIQDIFSLQYEFNEQFLQVKEKYIAQDDKYYFKELEKEAQVFGQDFTLLGIPYVPVEEGARVKVLLNNSMEASFIIDLHIPITMISQDAASILNVTNNMPLGTIDFTRINVPLGEAEPTFLDSIQVNELRVNNVTTLIMKELPYYGVDGVLGVSFFKHTIVRVDEKKKKLMVYEFTPVE